MKTKQAKDFLVQQAAEQAARENVPLSDLEKKMMYFTESDPTSCENPIDLNEEFEAKYDKTEYEAKISRLLHHAYDRLKTPRESAIGTKPFARFVGTTITFWSCGMSDLPVNVLPTTHSNFWGLPSSSWRAS